MTDWAKIAAGIKIGAGETAEGLVRELEAQLNELPPSARLEGVLEQMRDAGRLIGPDQIKNILHVKDLGNIEPYPQGLEAALLSESLMTLGKMVFEDHRLFYMPESFDGVSNSVANFKALVQAAEAERKKSKPEAKPIFRKDNNTDYQYEGETWAKSAPTKGVWILTPDTVPKWTRDRDFETQANMIKEEYPSYARGSAQEIIALLSLTKLLTGDRLYRDGTCGWTSTATDKAGASPGEFVRVGYFHDDGFSVSCAPPNYCGNSMGAVGAFHCWNFSGNS